jgi:hypothetical protein
MILPHPFDVVALLQGAAASSATTAASGATTSTQDIVSHLTAIIAAAGALGTAAMATVDVLKRTSFVGEAGFDRLTSGIQPLLPTLKVAYGSEYESVIRGHYRGDDSDLTRLLRQGVRIGLNADNAAGVASGLGSLDAQALVEASKTALTATTATTEQRTLLARFEAAADARIEAAVTTSHDHYVVVARATAGVVAIILAWLAWWALGGDKSGSTFWQAMVLGVVSVPIAPIAKNITDGIKAAAEALQRRA